MSAVPAPCKHKRGFPRLALSAVGSDGVFISTLYLPCSPVLSGDDKPGGGVWLVILLVTQWFICFLTQY